MESVPSSATLGGYPDFVDSSPRSRGGKSWDEPYPSASAGSSASASCEAMAAASCPAPPTSASTTSAVRPASSSSTAEAPSQTSTSSSPAPFSAAAPSPSSTSSPKISTPSSLFPFTGKQLSAVSKRKRKRRGYFCPNNFSAGKMLCKNGFPRFVDPWSASTFSDFNLDFFFVKNLLRLDSEALAQPRRCSINWLITTTPFIFEVSLSLSGNSQVRLGAVELIDPVKLFKEIGLSFGQGGQATEIEKVGLKTGAQLTGSKIKGNGSANVVPLLAGPSWETVN